MKITEIRLEPVRCTDSGIVCFSSFVLDDSIYIGSVALMTRPNGSLRLCYPTRKLGNNNIGVVYPINKTAANQIETKVLSEYRKLRGNEHECKNDRFF